MVQKVDSVWIKLEFWRKVDKLEILGFGQLTVGICVDSDERHGALWEFKFRFLLGQLQIG